MQIIFDYNRTLFNPDTNKLYVGVAKLLAKISRKHELFLISQNEPKRKDRIYELKIEKYFKQIVFVQEKTVRIFRDLIQDKHKVLVVGDRVSREITIGNKLGYITVWIQQGKFSINIPTKSQEQPDYTIRNLLELENIISKHEKE